MAITLDGTAGITTPDLIDSSLTSGRVVYAGASGNLTGASTFVFDGSNLGVGTSSPTTKLTIGTGTYSTAASGTTGMYTTATGLEMLSDSYYFGDRTGSIFMHLTSAGNLGLGVTPSAGGGVLQLKSGITFPATQSASSNANTLDDYEEGTWTPSLGGNTTYTTQAGKYIKIGRTVFVEGHLYINAIGTGSTSLVSGLPFTSDSQPTGIRATLSVNYFNAVANNIIYPALYLNPSATTAQFQAIAAAGTSMNTIAIFANSTDIYFSGTYYSTN
jgi:hypothetical protein